MKIQVNRAVLELVEGDITQQDTEAIVNAANSSLLGGGGVDGAIHRAGGPAILQECRAVRARQGGLPPGQAVATGAGRLAARAVIHAVGPVWRGGGHGEDELLASAYRASLTIARERRFDSVAFPCISTGAYGFPAERAARIAITTIEAYLAAHGAPAEVRLVVFGERDRAIYEPYFDTAEKDLP